MRPSKMKHYKFKFKYNSQSCKATGDGMCMADSIDEAFAVARKGVASDFGVSEGSVVITSMSLWTPRRAKQ